MGYTHYLYRPGEIPIGCMERIVEDFGEIVKNLEGKGISLKGWNGRDKPEISVEKIAFNGDAEKEEDYESCVVERVFKEGYIPAREGLHFSFCKTAHLPYDIAVTALYVIVKKHLGDAVKVHSDGRRLEWLPAIRLCDEVLRYGTLFKLDKD